MARTARSGGGPGRYHLKEGTETLRRSGNYRFPAPPYVTGRGGGRVGSVTSWGGVPAEVTCSGGAAWVTAGLTMAGMSVLKRLAPFAHVGGHLFRGRCARAAGARGVRR